MKVRIVRESMGFVNGLSLRHYHRNGVYEVNSDIANYLVAQGLAIFEMREHERRHVPRRGERRKH